MSAQAAEFSNCVLPHEASATMISLLKVVAIALATILAVELALRISTDMGNRGHALAVLGAADAVRTRLRRQSIARKFEEATGYAISFEELAKLEPRLFAATYSPRHRPLLAELHAEYRRHFSRLAATVAETGSQFIVLYLPSNWNDASREELINGTARELFRELAGLYDATFLDLREELVGQPWEKMTLHPRDSHLSEEANRIIATALVEAIDQHGSHRSEVRAARRPELFGDNSPNHTGTAEWEPGLPFLLTTNSQGLRMQTDVKFPKTRQRVLVLGDSFTFGPHIPDNATFPSQLAELAPHLEVLNAGYPAYTIVDEADLFVERAQFTEPDIVVLQVLDNDIYGMMSVMRNVFGRRATVHGETAVPSPAEAELLDSLLGSNDPA